MCVNIVHFPDAPGSNTASRWEEGNLTSLWFLLHYTDRCLDVTSILLDLECTFAQGGHLLVTKTKHQSDGIPQLAGPTVLTEFPVYSVNFFTTLGMTCICVAASKCSQNHFISEKYKILQSLKLHFLQESPFVELYVSASNCKSVGYIPASRSVKLFLAFLSHSQ